MLNSRAKGKRGELEIVHRLRDHGYDVRRGDSFRGEPDIVGMPLVHLEVKFRERIELGKFMDQAIRDAKSKYNVSMMPLLISKQNRKPTFGTMLLDDLLILLDFYLENHK